MHDAIIHEWFLNHSKILVSTLQLTCKKLYDKFWCSIKKTHIYTHTMIWKIIKSSSFPTTATCEAKLYLYVNKNNVITTAWIQKQI